MMGKGGTIAVIVGVLWLLWQRIQDLYYTSLSRKDENKVVKDEVAIKSQDTKIVTDKNTEERAVKKYEDS